MTASMLFMVIILVHVTHPVAQSVDSMWTLHVAMSIVREGNTNLDEYQDVVQARNGYAVSPIQQHLYYFFPIGTPLLSVPFVFVLDQVTQRSWAMPLSEQLHSAIPTGGVLGTELVIVSIIVALTTIIMYAIGRLYLSRWRAIVLALIFAFCTSAWSTASRGLWQHGPTILMLSLTLYLALLAQRRPALIQFAALPLAFSFVIRPTNSVSIALFTLYVFLRYRPYFVRYLLWSAVIAVPYVINNWSIYQAVLPPYAQPQRIASSPYFGEALLGNLISPARGVLIFTPVLILSAFGIALKLKAHDFHALDGLLVAAIIGHWIVISSYFHWWAGHSFGPRLFTDMLPYAFYFMIPVLERLHWPTSARAAIGAALVIVLIGVSGFIHWRGANFDTTWQWNLLPTNVDAQPGRLWDWSDLQFLR